MNLAPKQLETIKTLAEFDGVAPSVFKSMMDKKMRGDTRFDGLFKEYLTDLNKLAEIYRSTMITAGKTDKNKKVFDRLDRRWRSIWTHDSDIELFAHTLAKIITELKEEK